MANSDLTKNKSIALTKETHARLMQMIGYLQSEQKQNVKADTAVNVLLDNWEATRERTEVNKPGVLEQIFQKTEQ